MRLWSRMPAWANVSMALALSPRWHLSRRIYHVRDVGLPATAPDSSSSFFTQRCLSSSEPDAAEGHGAPASSVRYTRLPRLYVGSSHETRRGGERSPRPPGLLREDGPVPLSPDQSHYVTNVLRLGKRKRRQSSSPPDALVRIFDGVSGEWLARIVAPMTNDGEGHRRRRQQAGSEPVMAECIQCLRPQGVTSTSPSLWLVPTKKKERLRWLVEKATELNVQQFRFLDSEFGEAGSVAMDKLWAYAVEAAEQCERLDLPRFDTAEVEAGGARNHESLARVEEVLGLWQSDPARRSDTKLLICRERGQNSMPLIMALQQVMEVHRNENPPPHVAFLIGPEGGWSDREQEFMDDLVRQYPDDAVNVSLGSNILRAETAAITATAAFSLVADC